MVPPTDEDLAATAAAGDLAAFDVLMQRHEATAYKVAYGFAGSRDGALDIVQTAFLKAFRQLGRFRRQSAWKTWLLRIVLNEGYDWRRGQGRIGARQQPLAGIAELAAPDADPEAAALRRERLGRLTSGLRRLNRRHCLAVVLRYYEGMRIPEIAAVLGCTEVTTRNLLFRSLRRLRAELADGSRSAP
jgi:RNA polymerase sigma factor (sigma-70 family)